MGLEPQSLDNDVDCNNTFVTLNFSRSKTNWGHRYGCCGGTGMIWILVNINSLQMLSKTLYMSVMDMGTIACGSGASITGQ